MPQIGLTLHTALALAVLLTTVSGALRLVRRRWASFASAGAWEAALVCLVFALWQVVGGLARTRVTGGISHGFAVWHAERTAQLLAADRHSAAEQTAAETTFCVRDNGAGFDTTSQFPGHLGLQSMRERAANLGGKLDITSAPGEGTTVRLRIPTSESTALPALKM